MSTFFIFYFEGLRLMNNISMCLSKLKIKNSCSSIQVWVSQMDSHFFRSPEKYWIFIT